MDVLADAKDVLDELGVHFENSASEAAAAATLAASVHYPIRGAVTFKSPVGINVASDAIANLASGGVTGGTLIIIGEDYGEGSSIMQERSHPFAMKSQVWLLDPRPNLPTIVKAVEDGFELSEISHTPVMLEVRIRACHVHGRFTTKANKKPTFTLREALENPRRDSQPRGAAAGVVAARARKGRAALAGCGEVHQRAQAQRILSAPRLPMSASSFRAACTIRSCAPCSSLALPTSTAKTAVPIYCLNVTYPLIDDEVAAFAATKKAILMVLKGQPELHRAGAEHHLFGAGYPDQLCGKDVLPMAGEYTPQNVTKGLKAFLELHGKSLLGNRRRRRMHPKSSPTRRSRS